MDTHGLGPRRYELACELARKIIAARWHLDREDAQAAEQPYHTRNKRARNLDRAVAKGELTGLTYLLGRPDDIEAAEAFIGDVDSR